MDALDLASTFISLWMARARHITSDKVWIVLKRLWITGAGMPSSRPRIPPPLRTIGSLESAHLCVLILGEEVSGPSNLLQAPGSSLNASAPS
ncbi:hypothetical protein DFH11DRAFT_1725262 [Phellopilus nigrolimitatus]|nr:hypothetical protein DFH11DRAFT_1725262 [Phellopilus nigrolimitatus]